MNRETLEELRGLATHLVERLVDISSQPEIVTQLLTFEEAAERLAIGRTLVQELVDRGEIPVVSVTGRAVRIQVSDVEAFVKRKRERR